MILGITLAEPVLNYIAGMCRRTRPVGPGALAFRFCCCTSRRATKAMALLVVKNGITGGYTRTSDQTTKPKPAVALSNHAMAHAGPT